MAEQNPKRDDPRPTPEALLAAARNDGRGRLKIFLGAAPGVGKTYAMLKAAHGRLKDGVDVAIGVIETHGRTETQALVAGLEILPRLTLPYRDRMLQEFDLDAALKRHPKLILSDELAHTNATGARHPKRYQDVQELLAAGIDVYTTLHVQHLESLNDVVAKITRIRVRETLPDEILERADEVELVDLTPQELIKRLHEGKVYVAGQAQRALAHFFQPGNITALRELALRRVAERVDEQMLDYMRQHAIVGPWPAGERILVCIGPDADAPSVVRAGRRLADQLHAPWTALYVEMPGHYRLGEQARSRIADALRLAEQLDGEAATIPARDLVEELLRYARERNVTQIVIGYRRPGLLRRVLGRSLVEALLRHSGGIAVHVVPLARSARQISLQRFLPPLDWRRYLWSALYVAGAIGLGIGAEHVFPLPTPQPFFFLAVLLAAVRHGLAASVFASALSFAAYNFFFIDPRYTFTIAQPHEVIGLFLFFAVAVLVSGLAARSRDQAEDARQRMRAQRGLYEFSRKLATTIGLDDVLWAASYQIAATVRGKCVALLPAGDREGDDLYLAASYPPGEELGAGDLTAARWAWQRGDAAGHGTSTLPTLAWRFEPLTTSRGTVGVIGLSALTGPAELDSNSRRAVTALVDQTAVAIERANLDEEMSEARVVAASEKLRHALLSSISHDLRTPLASITGAVTSLKSYGASYDQATRADLLDTIEEEADRLNRFVGNLLDMIRLESGMLAPKRDWVAIDDLLTSAAARAKRHVGDRRIEIDAARSLPLFQLDFVLMEQVLFNLLDNAARYSPENSTILLRARSEAGRLIIEVIDSGRGIPAPDLERVFDKFHRVSGGDRQTAGTGLGLAICRGIVEAHGGQIRAVSPTADGNGTAIVITLPLPAATATENAA
jgi:two-component system sensor histidine kinase KdpD